MTTKEQKPSSLGGAFEHVGFYSVERVGGIGETSRSKVFLEVPQKIVALGGVRKFGGDTLFIVGIGGGRCAKFAYA